MSEYNIDNLNNLRDNQIETVPEVKKTYSRPLAALGAGLVTSVIVAIIWSIIGMWLEAEYWWVLILGVAIVGAVIHQYIPKKSSVGAVIGAVLCPATYLMYNLIMESNDYYYEDGDFMFWILLIGSVIYGACMGYNSDDE